MDQAAAEFIEVPNPVEWVRRYGDFLFRYAKSRLRAADFAEEVVQETFAAGLQSLHQFSGERGAERAWLLGILKRKIIDFIRERNRAAPLEDDVGTDIAEALFDGHGNWRDEPHLFGSCPSSSMERDEFRWALDECLKSLTPRQADAFVLREMVELTSDEVCRQLGISSSNLWVVLHRARLALQHCLKMKL